MCTVMYPAPQYFQSHPEHGAISAPNIEASTAHPSADELCDMLLDHIFGCDDCINGREESCPVYCALKSGIAAAGGPTRGAMLTM